MGSSGQQNMGSLILEEEPLGTLLHLNQPLTTQPVAVAGHLWHKAGPEKILAEISKCIWTQYITKQ